MPMPNIRTPPNARRPSRFLYDPIEQTKVSNVKCRVNKEDDIAVAEIQYYGTGRRKSATARVYLRAGEGGFLINRKTFDQYFPNETLRMIIRQPLQLTETGSKFDVLINVRGGGPAGQAGAIRHGITRALLEYNADLRPALKKAGLITRDPRIKERKKYGQKGARKRFQFSKR
jgi:small subunit ribosomal protein S9